MFVYKLNYSFLLLEFFIYFYKRTRFNFKHNLTSVLSFIVLFINCQYMISMKHYIKINNFSTNTFPFNQTLFMYIINSLLVGLTLHDVIIKILNFLSSSMVLENQNNHTINKLKHQKSNLFIIFGFNQCKKECSFIKILIFIIRLFV